MNITDIDIIRYNWRVIVLVDVTKEDINDVINELKNINCPDIYIKEAVDLLNYKDIDVGFTYSNAIESQSVVCISSISSTGELVQTTIHELFHLVSHISISNNFDNNEEECAYLIGDIARLLLIGVLKLFN